MLDVPRLGCQARHHAEAVPAVRRRGVIDDNQGLFSFSTPCRRCAGAGTVDRGSVPDVPGDRRRAPAREVKARIPAGVADGQTIRLKGRGRPGRNGGPAGDLFVEIHVAPPAVRRSGNDLTVRVPVTFAEAALGADIEVPTLDGPPVKLRIKPGPSRAAPPRQGQGHRRPEGRPAT